MNERGYIRKGLMAGALAILLLVWVLPATAPVAFAQEPPTHTVERGETLFGIARQYDLSVEELQRLNDLDDANIQVGQVLIVGEPGEEEAPEEEPAEEETIEEIEEEEELPPGRYRVEADQRFLDIARNLGVSADTLVALNANVFSGPLEAGTEIDVPAEAAPTETVVHTVEAGDNLTRIAGRYGVAVSELREVNNLQSDMLSVGQELEIPDQQPEVEAPEVYAEGRVLIYPQAFSGRLTASGDTYDPEAYTVSHPSLDFGTIVLFINPENSREVFARVNDRGPVDDAYVMEVSRAVADYLEIEQDSRQELTIYTFSQ